MAAPTSGKYRTQRFSQSGCQPSQKLQRQEELVQILARAGHLRRHGQRSHPLYQPGRTDHLRLTLAASKLAIVASTRQARAAYTRARSAPLPRGATGKVCGTSFIGDSVRVCISIA